MTMKMAMKRTLAIIVLAATMLSASSGWLPQFCAGFLDGPEEIVNPPAWHGAGWYCLSGYWPEQSIVAGPFAVEPGTQGTPDCNAF